MDGRTKPLGRTVLVKIQFIDVDAINNARGWTSAIPILMIDLNLGPQSTGPCRTGSAGNVRMFGIRGAVLVLAHGVVGLERVGHGHDRSGTVLVLLPVNRAEGGAASGPRGD